MDRLQIAGHSEYQDHVPAQISKYSRLSSHHILDGWSQGDEHYGCFSTSLSKVRNKSRR